MGDEDDRKEFIKFNSMELCKSTVIGAELVLGLLQKGLIDEEEKHYLSNHCTPNITRASLLYTTIANKWNHSQFGEFNQVLQESGNLSAFEVFTNAGAEVFLTNEQVQLLRNQIEKSETGCYEGIHHEDEVVANKIVKYARSGQLFSKYGRFEFSGDLERKEVVRLATHFAETFKNNIIWWNPWKPPLTTNFIPRSIFRTKLIESDGVHSSDEEMYFLSTGYKNLSSIEHRNLSSVGKDENKNGYSDKDAILYSFKEDFLSSEPEQETTTLIKETKKSLVVLVDAPGMGKSSEVSYVEQKLREKISIKRLILRVNLNEVQKALSSISEKESSSSVLHKLAPFLPSIIFFESDVPVFVFLDGLDEVCPKHQTTMVNVLRILTSSKDMSDLHVVVTTRPHLKEVLESKFELESWSLLPLTQEEQHDYLIAVGVSQKHLKFTKESLSGTLEDLLSNPLMLFMLGDVLRSGGDISESDLNIFYLYTRFVQAKHELHCVNKLQMEVGANYTDLHTKSLLRTNLLFYNHFALMSLSLDYVRGDQFLMQLLRGAIKSVTSGSNEMSELISYGLLVEDPLKNLVFMHQSFADYFYVRLLLSQDGYDIPQELRDGLLGSVYAMGGEPANVETFLVAYVSKAQTETNETYVLGITTRWMFVKNGLLGSCNMLTQFLKSRLFPLIAKEVLMNCLE